MKGPGAASKVTYVTLAGNEQANAAYDLAVTAARASLGATCSNWIDGRPAGSNRPLDDDRSPTDASVVVARFPRSTPDDVAAAIDGARRAATIDSKPVELTTGDFDILWLLASRQGNVVTRDEILRVVRGIDYDGLDRSIDARICRLRRKLQDAGGAESMIKTVRLRGYLFATE